MLNPNWLVGRTIVKVEMNAHHPEITTDRGYLQGGDSVDFRKDRSATMHLPRLTLDNGAELVFVVEEHPEAAYYGVNILYVPPVKA